MEIIRFFETFTAISLNISPNLVEIKYDSNNELLQSKTDLRRIGVTSAKNALNGYQKGQCFYCSRKIFIETGFNRLIAFFTYLKEWVQEILIKFGILYFL